MKILKTIFLCLIFIICYLIVYKFYILKKGQRLECSTHKSKINNDRMMWIFALILFLGSSYTYKSIKYGVLFAGCGLAIPKFYKNLTSSIEKRKVLIDLFGVVESLKVQLTSNMPLKLILKNLPEVCKYGKFKYAMVDLYLEYQLTGFSLTSSLRKLKAKFPYAEILMFSSAIEQHARGGNSEEAYGNLIQILKEKNIEFIEKNTESKTTLMILGVVIILINLLVMGCYPVIVEVNENLQTMLR